VTERNRVTPLGDIEAFPLRGAWTGNRGVLHEGHEIVRFHASNLWITCALTFRDYGREQWLPRRWTHLFFYDEAVALAAGHRPCAECRRADYVAYRDRFPDPSPSAQQMNRVLHGERIVRGTHRRRLHDLPVRSLPDGAFVLLDDGPYLVLGDTLVRWTKQGYAARRPRPARGTVAVITPPATVAVLRAGYPVQIDPMALFCP
jgi:hypothetical protein